MESKLHLLFLSALPLLRIAQADYSTLTTCLGPAISQYLITPTTTGTSAYTTYKWLSTGNRQTTSPRLPVAVLMLRNVSDTAKVVRCAKLANVPPVVRSGGHSFEALSSMSNSIVIDMSFCNKVVKVSSESGSSMFGIATFESGMRLGKLYLDLYNAGGWSFNAGACPYVGVGGHLTCGGKGYNARMYGMAADQIVSMDVVLGDGSTVLASATSHPELFWAMRGGGSGSFGIITRFTVNVFQTPQNSMFFLKFDAAAEVLNLWQTFFPYTPKELTCYLRFQVGNTVIVGHYLGPMSELQAIITASGAEKMKSFSFLLYKSCTGIGSRAFVWGDLTCSDLSVLSTNPIETSPKDYEKSKSDFVAKPIPMSILNQVVTMWYNAPRPDVYMACNLMLGSGGPLVTTSPTDTPFPSRNGTLFVMQYAIPGGPGDYYPGSPNYKWIQALEALLKPYVNGYKYQGYADLELKNFGLSYYGSANFLRLVAVKKAYDPLNIFANDQSIPLNYTLPEWAATSAPTMMTSAVPTYSKPSAISLLRSCLGPQLSPLLVTSNTTSSNSFSTYSWLSQGNRARVPRSPLAILMLQDISSVAAAVTCARRYGIAAVARGGGHSYEGFSSMTNSLIIDLSGCNKVIKVFEASNTTQQYRAQFEGGMRLGKLYTDLWNAGQFIFNGGVTPVVGVGGNILGGGRGFLGRKYGYAIDQIVSMNVVLSDGSTVVANATSHNDLFWALRGGNSGSFGIVTHFTANVYKESQHSMVFIRYSMGADVLNCFQNAFIGATTKLSVSMRLQSDNTYILAHYLGPMTELMAIVTSSGALTLPSFQWYVKNDCDGLTARTFSCCGDFTCSKPELLQTGFSKIEKSPKDYEKTKSDHMASTMPLSALQRMVELFQAAPRPDVYIEWNLLGGEGPYSSVSPTDTPFPSRNGTWNQMEYSVPGGPNDYYSGSPNYIWLQSLEAFLSPYVSGYKYQNYPDLELVNFGVSYFGKANYRRLIQIKNKYDPSNYFQNEQSIPLTYKYVTTPTIIPIIEPTFSPSSNGVQAICLYSGYCRTDSDCVPGAKCVGNEHFTQCNFDSSYDQGLSCVVSYNSGCSSSRSCCNPGFVCSSGSCSPINPPLCVKPVSFAPTAAPTVFSSPTFAPSRKPSTAISSMKPMTVLPTSRPTIEPTSEPSLPPTEVPSTLLTTVEATFSPTSDLSLIPPTILPTRTIIPSNLPSFTVTSMSPSKIWTVVPSTKTTNNPTKSTSKSPTTANPSKMPLSTATTSIPTAKKTTWVPSSVRSAVPTIKTTSSPTKTPSKSPITAKPSKMPIFTSTFIPTVKTTNPPSFVPSTIPTIEPTTTAPTAISSEAPSVASTISPSVSTTIAPTFEPSIVPSVTPTTVPTSIPSVVITLNPSWTATTSPTNPPSSQPATKSAPTGGNIQLSVSTESSTLSLTLSPTVSSTRTPSKNPTKFLSLSPNRVLSNAPSKKPSTKPTFLPSKVSSMKPTYCLSLLPTMTPTKIHSKSPTIRPSNSLPSKTPLSRSPTSVPSKSPTVRVTSSPTTNVPRKRPSNTPITMPTKTP